jgi:hypothetical protein
MKALASQKIDFKIQGSISPPNPSAPDYFDPQYTILNSYFYNKN